MEFNIQNSCSKEYKSFSQQLNNSINSYQSNSLDRNLAQQNAQQKGLQKSLDDEIKNSQTLNNQNIDQVNLKINQSQQYDISDKKPNDNTFANQVVLAGNELQHSDQLKNRFYFLNNNYSPETSSTNNDDNIQDSNENNKNLLNNSVQSSNNNQEIEEIKKNLRFINKSDFNQIINHLKQQEKKYQINYYLDHGGQADILVGTYQAQPNDELKECVFRMTLKNNDNRKLIEDAFIDSIKKPKFILKHIDKIILEDLNTIVFVLEKCQFNLKKQEQLMSIENKNYTFEELCKIIFSYFYILIELSIYKCVHFDIKPSNILKDNSNNYVITDFGCSCKTENGKFTIIGYTKAYCAPEIMLEGGYISHSADIYSTGKSLIRHLDFYLNQIQINQTIDQITSQQNQTLQDFCEFIKIKMLEKNPQARISCLDLVLEGYKILGIQNKELQKFIKLSNKQFYQIEWLNKEDDKKYLQQVIVQLTWIDIQIFVEEHQLNYKPDDIFIEEKHQQISTKFLNIEEKQIKRYLKLILQIGRIFNQNGDQVKYKQIANHSENILLQQPELNIFNIDIAYYHLQQRNYDQAIGYYQQFLKSINANQTINEKKSIKNQELIIYCHLKIGFCFQNAYQYDQSLFHYEIALNAQKKLYNQSNHLEIATTLENIGELYQRINQIQKGSEKINEASKMRKELNQEVSTLKYSYILITQAYNFKRNHQYSDAIKLQMQSLDIREKFFNENSPLIAETCQGIGDCITEMSQFEEALKYYDQATKIYSKEDGNRLSLAACLYNKGSCYQQYNKYDNAINCYYESILIRIRYLFDQKQELVGKENILIRLSVIFYQICECYIHMGKYKQIVYFMYTYICIIDLLNQTNQIQKIYEFNWIKRICLMLGKPQLALQFVQKSQLLIDKYPDDNNLTIEILISNTYQGQAYLMLGEYKKAEQYCNQAYQMIREKLKDGQDRSIKVLIALESVGHCNLYLKNYEQALDCFKKCQTYRQNIYNKDHVEHSFSYFNLGKYYQFIGDLESSIENYLESYRIREIKLPQTSPLVIQSKMKVVYCALKLAKRKNTLFIQ